MLVEHWYDLLYTFCGGGSCGSFVQSKHCQEVTKAPPYEWTLLLDDGVDEYCSFKRSNWALRPCRFGLRLPLLVLAS